MFIDTLKNYFLLNSVDKYIAKKNFDIALNILNALIENGFQLDKTYIKRGVLCKKLLMLDDAYSDFTFVINHYEKCSKAYYERMKLNYDISNYGECISDAELLLSEYPNNNDNDCILYKFLSLVYLNKNNDAKEFMLNIYDQNKYKVIQFIFNETAKNIAINELAKALKLLEIIELTDPYNPMKIFNEAKIYELAGQNIKAKELYDKLESVFPKYFISHFRFTDMYAEKDLYEISFLLELKVFDKLNFFSYPMCVLEGYKSYLEGHIINSKEAFERAIEINSDKPEAYVLLAQTLQLMSGYDNPNYKNEAEENYKKAMAIYQKENLTAKTEDMKRQIKHLNSTLSFH